MPALTRVVFAGIAVALAICAMAPAGLRAQTRDAVPTAVLGAWSWRAVGEAGDEPLASVTTDTAFPYRICGSTTAGRTRCLPNRRDGEGNAPVVLEWIDFGGTTPVAIDPIDADVLYGGAVARFDRRTAQQQNVTPALEDGEPAPKGGLLFFAPNDPRTLFFATSTIRKTGNSGLNWTPVPSGPSAITISAVAISPVDSRTMWLARADGALAVTRDSGVTWTDATAPSSASAAFAGAIEPSRFDPATAYIVTRNGANASVATRAFRTRDGGRTWQAMDAGLDPGVTVNVVREDPLRRGLLFAATSSGVAVSIDDGDSWQSLTLNLPAGEVVDLVLRDADVIAALRTGGFWVLDDMSPLRQLTVDVLRQDAFLFRPAQAWRPRTHATAAMSLAYATGPGLAGSLTLEVIETASGDVIRRFASNDTGAPLPSSPGLHRVTWDMRSTPIRGRGVLVQPGTYQLRLTAGARVFRQAIVVRMDPRVRTSAADLDAQFSLSKRVYLKVRELAGARSAEGVDPAQAAALDQAAITLVEILDILQQSDTRPTPALAAVAGAAIDRANALLPLPQP